MADSMRAFGTVISEMEKGLKGIQMAILTLDSLSMVKHMVRESIPGKTGKCTTENGIKA